MTPAAASRHVLITGAGRGIGRAIAAAFIAAGDRVTLLGRSRESLDGAARELGAAGVAVADVTQSEELTQALHGAADTEGPVEVLVNNAGTAETAPFGKTSTELLRRMMAVNLEGALTAIHAVLPSMVERRFGRIVTVASTAGLRGYPYVSAYCAAKHAVVGLTRSLALELAKSGVTVNAVCPGYTDTDLVHSAVDRLAAKTAKSGKDILAEMTKFNPQGRLVAPEEVADAVLWLAGRQASAVTGQAIVVAGGELA